LFAGPAHLVRRGLDGAPLLATIGGKLPEVPRPDEHLIDGAGGEQQGEFMETPVLVGVNESLPVLVAEGGETPLERV
jgi:hypothetical protein